MARKPDGGTMTERGLGPEDAETARAADGAAEAVKGAAQTAAAMAPALRDAQRGGERTAVLSNGPIPEVKLGAVEAPNPRGMEDFPGVDRSLLDPDRVAPVVADATTRTPLGRKGEADDDERPKERKYFIVLEAKQVVDKTSGARTRLPGGKVIHDGHYDIAHLLRQGVKLRKTEAPGTAEGDEALIAALTE